MARGLETLVKSQFWATPYLPEASYWALDRLNLQISFAVLHNVLDVRDICPQRISRCEEATPGYPQTISSSKLTREHWFRVTIIFAIPPYVRIAGCYWRLALELGAQGSLPTLLAFKEHLHFCVSQDNNGYGPITFANLCPESPPT